MSDRVYNFSAGPCTMPEEVLEHASKEMLSWQGCGIGVMEMSHRGKEFVSIYNNAQKNIRELLSIPANYKCLMLQGGAYGQFASVPLNMLGDSSKTGDYLVTGQWGDKAAAECAKYGKSNRACDTKPTKYTVIPDASTWKLTPGASFVCYCANETVNGVEWKSTPNVESPLVGDHSSNFCSKPIEIEKHMAIYAGAQKNAGIAGLTYVIVREDVMGKELPICPSVMSWKMQDAADSMLNTPACYAMYMAGLYLDYMVKAGGVKHWDAMANKKSSMLYDTIDESNGFYTAPVEKKSRSRMNVPFQIQGGNEALEKKFMEEAKKVKLYTLAGHRSVGGLRASLYNGMKLEGVACLADFMKLFAQENAA
jgi:phosphoserine aminotransferase